MMYLLAVALSLTSVFAAEADRRLVTSQELPQENLVMEQKFLDTAAWHCALGAFNAVESFFHRRRIEDDSERLNFVVDVVTDVAPQRRLVCGGLCIGLATAVTTGIFAIGTAAAPPIVEGIFGLFNSVEAPDLNIDMSEIDAMATAAAQGAFDAVETAFGIAGVETFGDNLAQAIGTQRRIICGGLCIALGTAIAGGIAGGVATGAVDGLFGLAGSIEAADLNVDASMFTAQQIQAVASIETATFDQIAQIASQGAIDGITPFLLPFIGNPAIMNGRR